MEKESLTRSAVEPFDTPDDLEMTDKELKVVVGGNVRISAHALL